MHKKQTCTTKKQGCRRKSVPATIPAQIAVDIDISDGESKFGESSQKDNGGVSFSKSTCFRFCKSTCFIPTSCLTLKVCARAS